MIHSDIGMSHQEVGTWPVCAIWLSDIAGACDPRHY